MRFSVGSKNENINLPLGSHIHLMGICGTAMASLAGLLKDLGYRITGSDQNVYPPMSTQLEKLGIPIQVGYRKQNLEPRPDLVIVGNVITRNHEEAQALLASDIPYTSLPKAMGEFVIQNRHSVVVSGTHGKTTTTAMMSWIADQCGKSPGFMVGGIPVNYGKSFEMSKGDYFIVEGDEYDTAFFDKVPKFVHYKPRSVILTSVEFDHADIYEDLAAVKSAFVKLMVLIPENGNLVYWADAPVVQEIAETAECHNKIGYGLKSGEVQAANILFTDQFCEFDILKHGVKEAHARLSVFGRHNVLNALACYALAMSLGWDQLTVLQALETFKGVKRRQEIIGTPNGITVIEDFAHHPTAVDVTIEAVKERYHKSKVIALFEPRSATSRRAHFQKDYVRAFRKADVVIFPEVYNSQVLSKDESLSPQKIVEDLGKLKREAYSIPKIEDILNFLKGYVKPTDVILIMSNGSFGGIYQKLLDILK